MEGCLGNNDGNKLKTCVEFDMLNVFTSAQHLNKIDEKKNKQTLTLSLLYSNNIVAWFSWPLFENNKKLLFI